MLTILTGDAIEQLRTLPDQSVQCCVTSPPYWGLRDYSTNGQLGLEKTPEEYVAKMVELFREVRRVLRKDGTLWMNSGDSYWNGGGEKRDGGHGFVDGGKPKLYAAKGSLLQSKSQTNLGLKPKDLCGIPWRVAFALQADGWWLRSDIIWAKPNPMPESVTDRPTKSHEYLFLLTKSANYFYDAEAIKEQAEYGFCPTRGDMFNSIGSADRDPSRNGKTVTRGEGGIRNKRSVWTVATAPYPEAHFATYPPDLIKPCIMAGTSAKGCCAKCGAPWERVVENNGYTESTSKNYKPAPNKGHLDNLGERAANLTGDGFIPNRHKIVQTVGWQPTCQCNLNSGSRTGSPPNANGVSRSDPLVQHREEGDYSCQHLKPTANNAEDTIASEKGTSEATLTFKPEGVAIVPCTVLDPFAGSGTTGAVALELGRKAVLIELNPKYVNLIRQRCDITPGLQLA